MRNAHGEFIWYELITPDVAAAADFYGAVLGWGSRATGDDARSYHLFSAGPTEVAGLMRTPRHDDGNGMPPAWFGYIGVDDVDRIVAELIAAGARQHVPPTDIPGVGRFAMLADPQGIAFYVMRGSIDARSESFSPMQAGHCRWNELSTPEQAAALEFYGRHFGWQPGDAMPMGELGDYRFIHHGGQMIGAVMRHPPGDSPPMWHFYFGVPDIDAATSTVKAKGGTVNFGPDEIPGGEFALVGTDPQGARFGLVGPRRQPA